MQTTQRQPVLVGTSLPRQDGPDKVTGRARYAGDQALPGMLYARLVTSPYAHARLLNIDTSAALSIPGVVAAFTAETLEMAQVNQLSRAQSPLALDEVVWCGHPVAIVVGETEAIAGDGADAVEVDYDPLPAVIDPEDATRPDSPPARSRRPLEAAGGEGHTGIPQAVPVEGEGLSPNVSQTPPLQMGDVEAGLREAEVVVEGRYRTHPVHQSYMETHSVTVAPSLSGHHLVIWPSTQGLFTVRSVLAQALGMPERQVRVEPVPIGGVVQGIGWALLEGMTYDESGQLLTSTLMDYALPYSHDAPAITPLLVEVPSALGPFGAKGVGEPPVVPVAAAIANAIRDAVGVRITQIPMTPERVFASLKEAK